MRDHSLDKRADPVGTIPRLPAPTRLLLSIRGGENLPYLRSAAIFVFPGLFSFLAACFLSACAAGQLDKTPSFGENLRGKHKHEILACAGPPGSEVSTGDGLLLVYTRSAWALNRSMTTSEDTMTGSRPRCRATITLQDDRVVGVEYQSIPESAQALDHCDRIFFNCGG